MSILVSDVMQGFERGVSTYVGPSGLSGKRMVSGWRNRESVTRRSTEILLHRS